MKLDKIRHNKLFEDIVRLIEEMMIDQHLVPGDRLPSERELTRMLGVSRTAVRQALAALKEKGLIEIRVGDGTYAKRIPEVLVVTELADLFHSKKQQIVDPIEVRQLLEPQIARLSAKRATKEDIGKIEQLLSREKEQIKLGEHLSPEMDLEFHKQIALTTANELLADVLEATFTILQKSRFLSLSTNASPQKSLEGHQRIFEAIRDRDPDLAYDTMLQHIEDIRQLIINNYSE